MFPQWPPEQILFQSSAGDDHIGFAVGKVERIALDDLDVKLAGNSLSGMRRKVRLVFNGEDRSKKPTMWAYRA